MDGASQKLFCSQNRSVPGHLIFRFTIAQRKRRLLLVWWLGDQVLYELVEPLPVALPDGRTLVIPPGTVTDGASVPWLLRWLFPQQGRYTRASLAHDYLYDNRIGTRPEADRNFLHLMLADNVPAWKAYLFYFAVKVGGKKWWDD